MKLVTVFDCSGNEVVGLILEPTSSADASRPPKIRLKRTSFINMADGLCPSNQICEKGPKDVFGFDVTNMVHNRSPQLKGIGYERSMTLSELKRVVA